MEETDNTQTGSKPPSDAGKQVVIGVFLLGLLVYAAIEILNKEEKKTGDAAVHADSMTVTPEHVIANQPAFENNFQPQEQTVITSVNPSTSSYTTDAEQYTAAADSSAYAEEIAQPVQDKYPVTEQRLPDLNGTWLNPENEAKWVFKQNGNKINIEVFKRNGKKKGEATGTYIGNHIEVEYKDFNFDTFYGNLFLSDDQKNLYGKLETNLGFAWDYSLNKID